MRSIFFIASLVTVIGIAHSQNCTRFCDPLTKICYSSYTNSKGVAIRVALPDTTQAPYDSILQIVAPVENGWVGFDWGGSMVWNPLTVAWPNGASVVASSRWAYGYNIPAANPSAEYTYLKGTGVNSTHWTLTISCKGCSQWSDSDGNPTTFNSASKTTFGMAQAKAPVLDPASNTSAFDAHDSFENWDHDLTLARSSLFNNWVASNLYTVKPSSPNGSPPSNQVPLQTTKIPSTTLSTSKVRIPRQTAAAAIPASCSGVAAAKFPSSLASGWKAVKIAGGLTTPRGIIIDSAGHLLVVQNGKGITAFTLATTGCVASSKTVISQTNLNHGIYLSPDGKTLYASSMTTVWKWTYSATDATISGSSTVVVNGMNNGGHSTRTLTIPKNKPNLLVVSCGSNANLDIAAGNMATERAVVKVFDMSSVPSGGYNYVTGGYQAGYGLRNEVGIVFDGNNMLWGVENSSDDITRTVNGQATDIHTDNPAEELNYLGDVSTANTKWYGYPTCFTVWAPSAIKDKTFAIGDQFVLAPNSTFDDSTCIARSTPARLSFQAHSAPLDSQFDASFTTMYVSFHGSWDRQPPTGFKLVAVPFSKGSDGSYAPTAPATSGSGYSDIFWNTDTSTCSATKCFRPVGIAVDSTGRIFLTSDSGAEGELFLLGKS